MSGKSSMAVRFQWLSDYVDSGDIANEPHSGVIAKTHSASLDLTSDRNGWARNSGAEAIIEYGKMLKYPERHRINMDIDMSARARKVIEAANELNPEDYKDILLTKGMGRATLRSLAFVSSLIYDKELAYRDPVMYAYNLGGKDRIPFEINRRTYDNVCKEMQEIIENSRVETGEKYKMLKRLSSGVANNPTQ